MPSWNNAPRLLQIAAVAMPLFGRAIVFPLLAPLGLCQLALAIWLITKGFSSSAAAPNPLRD